jgi:hypothetical protein
MILQILGSTNKAGKDMGDYCEHDWQLTTGYYEPSNKCSKCGLKGDDDITDLIDEIQSENKRFREENEAWKMNNIILLRADGDRDGKGLPDTLTIQQADGDEADTYSRQNQWIPVEERLPEDCEIVLFYVEGKKYKKTHKGIYLGGCKTFEEEYTTAFYLPFDEVTHWKPITPPRLNKEDK